MLEEYRMVVRALPSTCLGRSCDEGHWTPAIEVNARSKDVRQWAQPVARMALVTACTMVDGCMEIWEIWLWLCYGYGYGCL